MSTDEGRVIPLSGGKQRRAEKARPKADRNDPGLVTEDDVALAFTREHAGRLRFDHDVGAWFEWDGDRWAKDGTQRAFAFCRELARRESDGDMKTMKTARRAAFAAGVERFARAAVEHAVTQETWDRDPWLVGAPGVTVDLRTGAARAPDPADGITKRLAVAPAVVADCPRWLAFLNDATGGDADMIRFLQTWAGYCLTGDTSEHKLVFCYGPGGNGKSVFLNTLTGILGDYAVTAMMETFVASKSDRHPTELAMLRGARLVTASETEEGRAWAESRIKQLTGGDKISARFMRQDAFSFRPTFKLLVVGNHKPVLRNCDDAARRRFLVVPFTRRPQKPDPRLEDAIRAEWPGVLRWAIDGCLAWQRQGLTVPSAVTAATSDYFTAQDVFGQWLDDECEVEIGTRQRWTASQALFDAWAAYARRNGEEPGSTRIFTDLLSARGFMPGRKKLNGRATRGWFGLSLALKGEGDR